MIDLIAWILTINENADLREELAEAKRALARLPLEQQVAAHHAENQELRLRLGVVIRILAEKGILDPQELVAAFNQLKTSAR